MSKDPKVLHVVKWYPHASDPQNGIFVQKHIEATSDAPLVLGFVNSKDKLEELFPYFMTPINLLG
ncbi:MAG: hypothetical protein EBY63_05690 [Flavobacteriia bacterium]|nr:hypothetical protein [Flavobacteriia bacterium]